MASPESTNGFEPIRSSNAAAASDAANTGLDAAGHNAGVAKPDISDHSSSADVATAPASGSAPDFNRAADDAMWLLMYAAETGRSVDDTTRDSVLRANAAASGGWDDAVAANLLVALTKLAAQVSPATAESLRAGKNETKPTIRSLRKWTIFLAIPIILFSLLSFLSSSITTVIRTDITTANELVVKLRAELGTAEAPRGGTPAKPELPKGLNEGDVITQLQLYASTIRAIDTRARQLNWFVFGAERDPFAMYRWDSNLAKKGYGALSDEEKEALSEKEYEALSEEKKEQLAEQVNEANEKELKGKFQLPVGLPNMPLALDTLTTTYQDVRSFATDIIDLVSVSYGAITTCLLPVLYALLGTCAYLLRRYEEELRTMTFTPSRTHWARFLIAGIGGAVVGLFGNFTITQGGASISPLAIAFLVGYAVDVFFTFLEGLLQAFTKGKGSASSPTGGPSPA